MSEEKKQLTYADAGVDIDAGNRAVELMKDSVRASYRPEVIGDLGGGVGTKLKFAFLTNNHSTIGQDAVAMCVNDILVQGAEPLFFLDYIAVDKVDSQPEGGGHRQRRGGRLPGKRLCPDRRRDRGDARFLRKR